MAKRKIRSRHRNRRSLDETFHSVFGLHRRSRFKFTGPLLPHEAAQANALAPALPLADLLALHGVSSEP